jgi:hypothetical protein
MVTSNHEASHQIFRDRPEILAPVFRILGVPRTAQSTHPLVLGPDNVPVVTDRRTAARDITLAAFSALTHGREQDADAILKAVADALQGMDNETVEYFGSLLDLGLGDAPGGQTWRKLMTFHNFFPGRGTLLEKTFFEGKAEGKAEGRAEGVAEGKAEGEAQAILRILAARGIDVPERTRERILVCADLDVLGRWLDRSVHAQSADELFAGEADQLQLGEGPSGGR